MNELDVQEAVSGHAARNAQLQEALRKKRVDIKSSRPIDCHFWAGSRKAAQELAQALRSRGFTILVQRKAATPSVDFPWNVEARVIQSVDLTTRPEFTDELVRLAFSHHSVYDGWGTSLSPDEG